MRYLWLNRQNNDKLIMFFAGWSFDGKPFEYLSCLGFDVLFVYDYNDLSLDIDLKNYREKYLVTWSMGVYAAYKIREFLPEFDKKIAVNGTVFPVDDDCGIPEKPFLLTLKHAEKGLEKKFYQNIFETESEFERYLKNPVERSIENRVSELEYLYNVIKNDTKHYAKYYDIAYISKNDKIIPPKNQINFWTKYETDFKLLESGHFPYYNYSAWKELL